MNARLRHEIVWAPLGVAALIAAIGLAGLLFRQPLLFASLGPTAYLLVHSPMQPAAQPYNVIVGHLIALSTAFVVTALTGAADEPSVFVTHELVFIRVVCSAVALGLAVAMELLLQASHPPAAATSASHYAWRFSTLSSKCGQHHGWSSASLRSWGARPTIASQAKDERRLKK